MYYKSKLMKRYELFKELPNFTKLIASGIVPISMSVKLQVYEKYLEIAKTKKKSIAIKDTADYFDLSDSQIYKVVSFMES